ncbi:MAG: hypothetical protein SFW08_01830 [Gemmatimonadaceae bacterium]|nr:hypothetical protein [Gemmatimonadaceae bacterium]
MPSYDVRAASLALDVPYAALDVLLARHDIVGVSKGGQGVARRIHDDGLLRLAIALQIQPVIGSDTRSALHLAEQLVSAGGVLAEGPLEIRVDLAAVRSALMARMSDVVERVVPVRRGRPPSPR